jgi:hypothetical protein
VPDPTLHGNHDPCPACEGEGRVKGNAEALQEAIARCDLYYRRSITRMSERRINEVIGQAFRFVVYGEGGPAAMKGAQPLRQRRSPPAAYVECASRGMSMAETARELGYTREAVRQIALRYPELRFVDGNQKRAAARRAAE